MEPIWGRNWKRDMQLWENRRKRTASHSLEERSGGECGWTTACVSVKEAGHGSTGLVTGSSSHPRGPVPSAQCQDNIWVGNGKGWCAKQTVKWNQPFSWSADPWFSNCWLSGPPSCSAILQPTVVPPLSQALPQLMSCPRRLFPGFFISSLKVAQNHFNFWRSRQKSNIQFLFL